LLTNNWETIPDLIITSSYQRAMQTAEIYRSRFSMVPMEVWDVHEFTFLGDHHYAGTTERERSRAVRDWWEKNDPHYVESAGAESFAQFIDRIDTMFHRLKRMPHLQEVMIFTHGHFIRAAVMEAIYGGRATLEDCMTFFQAFTQAMRIGNTSVTTFIYDDEQRLNLVTPIGERPKGFGVPEALAAAVESQGD
jgi:broad specificity phosphatase PhoE